MQPGRTPPAAGAPRLPNFLIIGATKCGTESLHRYLCDHPEVFMHPRKEMRFFTEEHHWWRGPDWYRAQFSGSGEARAVGESSNSYTRHPVYGGVPERIGRLLPEARLIYVIRHPIKRIESHYRHRLVTGIEWRTPEKAIRDDPGYIAASRFGDQLERYLRHFPPEQILTVRLDHLIADPEASLGRICRFLGVGPMPGVGFPKVNVSAQRVVAPATLRWFARFPAAKDRVKSAARWYRRVGPDWFTRLAGEPAFAPGRRTLDELAAIFRDDLALLSQLLGERFDDWDLDAHAPDGPIPGGPEPPGAGDPATQGTRA